MSALADAAVTTLIEALAAEAAVAALVHAIGDAGERASPAPALWIAERSSLPWGSKDRPGSEVRIDLAGSDRGDGVTGAAIDAAVTAAISGLPRAFAGWECSEWLIVRRRTQRLRNGERRTLWSLRLRGWPAN